MRQGNGAELLGSNDARSGTIGVIDVAPNDDREGVVAAILTQDKLGRKQIVLNLPAENRAFQRPVDFDGLKNMRRKLQAQLIVIAPGGSAPAEFARQRRFPIFYSKEGFRQSLGGEPAVEEPQRRGGIFGAGRARLQPVEERPIEPNGSHAAPVEPVVPMPLPLDAAPPPAPAPAGMNGSIDQEDTLAPAGQDEAEAPLPEPIQLYPRPPRPGQPYAQPAAPQDEPEEEADEEAHGAPPIPLILPVPAAQPHMPAANANQPPRRSSAPMAAVGAGGAAGGAAAATTIAGVTPPPPPAVPGGSSPPPRRPRRRGQFLLLALALLLLLTLTVGGIALAAPGVFGSFGRTVSNVVSGQPGATVTITPVSKQVSSSFTIQAITGTPSGQYQVQARNLSFTTPSTTKQGKATGHAQNPATNATGSLTFYNASSSVQVVLSGTVFNVGNGVQIENTQRASIPPAHGNPPTEGSTTVAAKAVTAGSRGNIPAYTLNLTACCGGPIVVSNTSAFTGGQNAQNYMFVQQSDVTTVAAPLQAQLTTQALSSLSGEKHAGEQFVHEPTCTTSVTSNPPVGTHVTNTTISVSVTANCKGEVFDAAGAQRQAAALLVQQINPKYPHYMLAGSVQTGQPSITGINKSGTIDLTVTAQGIWAYHFSATDLQNLAKLIAGKSKDQAQALLLQQPGVGQVNSISIANNGASLPTDPTQIKIVVQSIPGLPGITPTTSPPTTGTPVSSPTQGNG